MKFFHHNAIKAGAAAREREAQAEPRHTTKGLITSLRTPVGFRLRRFLVPAFAFLAFIFVATGTAAGFIEQGPVASGLARPAFLAASGEPSREEIGGSVSLGIYLLGGALIFLQIVQFFRPQPPNHKQFADRVDTEKQLDKVLLVMKELGGEFRGYQSEQAQRRRVLYSRVSRLENALCFMEGQMGHSGDREGAEKLRAILNTRVEAAHDE